jgi:hypothetical protein
MAEEEMRDEPAAVLRPGRMQSTPLRLTVAVASHTGTLTCERPVLADGDHIDTANGAVRRMLEMLRIAERDEDEWAVAWQIRHLADPFDDLARQLATQAAARLALGQGGWPAYPPRRHDDREPVA